MALLTACRILLPRHYLKLLPRYSPLPRSHTSDAGLDEDCIQYVWYTGDHFLIGFQSMNGQILRLQPQACDTSLTSLTVSVCMSPYQESSILSAPNCEQLPKVGQSWIHSAEANLSVHKLLTIHCTVYHRNTCTSNPMLGPDFFLGSRCAH